MRDSMVLPDEDQFHRLFYLRQDVLRTMTEINDFDTTRFEVLETIPLGVLRKNATQKHGVTKWKQHQNYLEIESVEIHPELLKRRWNDYAKFVLYHEFLHAIGFKDHDAIFRHLEARWPIENPRKSGREFTLFLQEKSASWKWFCDSCGLTVFRKKSTHGKYKCKSCNIVLRDEPVSSQ